jgi:hypothetical protein
MHYMDELETRMFMASYLVTFSREYVIDTQISRDPETSYTIASYTGDYLDFKEVPRCDLLIGVYEADCTEEAIILGADKWNVHAKQCA